MNLLGVVKEWDSTDDFLETLSEVKGSFNEWEGDVFFVLKGDLIVIKEILDFVDEVFWTCFWNRAIVNHDFGHDLDKVTYRLAEMMVIGLSFQYFLACVDEWIRRPFCSL